MPKNANRRFAAAGLMRRPGVREISIPGGAIQYLLDYNDADTKSRPSEAANVDMRDPAEGGTGAYAGDFVKKNTAAEALAYSSGVTSITGTPWANTNEVTITTGQADPEGGTGAVKIEDLSSAPNLKYSDTTDLAAYPTGNEVWFSVWVKQELAGNFHTFGVVINDNPTSSHTVGIDPATGETAIIGGIPTQVYCAELVSGWYFLAFRYGGAAGTSIKMRCFPAYGTSFPTVSGPATGPATVYNPVIADYDVLGPEIANPTPWADANEMRINPVDGAILIEGQRENEIQESSDFTTWWGSVLTSPDAAAAPDGGANATRVELASGVIGPQYNNSATTLSAMSVYVNKGAGDGSPSNVGLAASTVDAGGELFAGTLAAAYERIAIVNDGQYVRMGDGRDLSAVPGGVVAGAREYVAWNAQFEDGAKFISSPIRTSGAAATRNKDVVKFAAGNYPAALVEGKASWTVWPNFSSADIIAESVSHRIFSGAGNESLSFRTAGAVAYVAYFATSGAVRVQVGGTWSVGQKITITVDWVNKLFSVSGMTTGDQADKSFTGGSDIVPAAEALTIGCLSAGGNVQQFDGTIGRPVAA